MKDLHYVLIFTGIGLVTAYAVSTPLRQSPAMAPRVGTPLRPTAMGAAKTPENIQVYAEGSISLGSGISAQTAASRTLFIIARPTVNGQPTGGPPLAVQKIEAPVFPMVFSLTNANNIVGEDFYDGDLVLFSRLDADGKAGPKQPDDLESSVIINAKTGQRQVQITLQK